MTSGGENWNPTTLVSSLSAVCVSHENLRETQAALQNTAHVDQASCLMSEELLLRVPAFEVKVLSL